MARKTKQQIIDEQKGIMQKRDLSFLNNHPAKGCQYIYIYASDNEVLYVGQTGQSLLTRYRNHICSDNAGAKSTKQIYAYEVPDEFADYAEGYIGYFLNGSHQVCLPNHEKDKYAEPGKEIMDDLENIVNYFTKLHDCKVITPLSYCTLPSYESGWFRCETIGAKKHAGGRPTHESKGKTNRKQYTLTLLPEDYEKIMDAAGAERLSFARFVEKAVHEYINTKERRKEK